VCDGLEDGSRCSNEVCEGLEVRLEMFHHV